MKKFGLSLGMLLLFVATTSGFAHAATSTDVAQARLRLSADAAAASEHILLPTVNAQGVGAEYSVSTTIEHTPDNQISAIIWRIENSSGRTLRNVRLFPLIDIDLDAAADSYLDERAAVSELGLYRPATLTPDAWDAGELGYWHGDLLARVRTDALQSPVQVVAAEDQTLAWRFVSGDWFAGAVATLRLDVAALPTPGIYVMNSDARRVYVEAQLELSQPENQLPTVSFNTPAGGETVDIGSVIHLDVAASDQDGSISEVEVFANGGSIGVIAGTSPYLLEYTATNTGSLVFTAIATDDRGGATTSAAVNLVVRAANVVPMIALTAPADGSAVDVGTVVTVTALTTDSDGTVTQVEFFQNGVLIGVVTGAGPHSVEYTASTVGSIVFTAIATDDRGGATTSAAVNMIVRAANVAPAINLTAPADGSTVDADTPITVTAAATDSDGTVTQVEFFANGASIGVVTGSGPHTVAYTASTVGPVVFTAIATDDRGGATTSAAVNMIVRAANVAPMIALTAPADGSAVDVGTVVTVTALTTDSDGTVTQVEFFQNGVLIGVVTGAGPHSVEYTASTVGSIVFTAIATDDRGGATTSAAVNMIVRAANVAPAINLTAPADGSTVDADTPITVMAAATDSDGTVTQVEFFANGQSIGVVTGSGPHSVEYTASTVGPIVFTAIATDDRGGATTSVAANVEVRAANVAPVIALTAPADASAVEVGTVVTVTAAATDSDGTVTQVEFFANGVLIGVVTGSGPYAVTYTASTVGAVVLTAIATDDRGGTTTSAAVTLTVRSGNVEFEANTDLTSDHHVLIWMSCDNPAPPQTEAACATERSLYLHGLLNRRGIEHRIVHSDADFLAALRCGLYNTYWISGGVGHLSKASIDEIGANLLHGHALIVDARHDERNHGLDTYLGAQSTGRLGDEVPVTWTSDSGRAFSFPSVAAARRIHRNGAEVLGYFNNGSADGAVLRQRNALGTAIWFAFDWVEAARAVDQDDDDEDGDHGDDDDDGDGDDGDDGDGDDDDDDDDGDDGDGDDDDNDDNDDEGDDDGGAANQDQALFDQIDAIFATASVVLTQPLAAGTHVGLTSVVRNTSNTTQTLTLRGQWPQTLAFAQGLDLPDTLGSDAATWTLELAPQSERAVDWGLRLPAASGEFVVEISISNAFGLQVEQQLTLRSNDGASRVNAARATLLALNLSGQNAAKRTLAIRAIDDSLAAIIAAQTSTALGKALDAIGRTREISALGTEPVLVALGLLARSLEATICQSVQPACPVGVVASGNLPFAPALPNAGWQIARQQGAFVQRAGASLASVLAQPITLAVAQTYRWRLTRDGSDRLLTQIRNSDGDLIDEAQSAQGLIYGNAVRVSGSGRAEHVSLAVTALDGVAIGAVSAAMTSPQLWFAPGWQRIEGEFTLASAAAGANQDFIIQWQAGELACRQP